MVAFVLGLGLYGTVYLIPLYLDEVQGYSPLLIGETLIWVGLPQLLIFPLLPILMKKFDIRMLVFFGSILFAVSCFMNSFMSFNYAKDQFIVANIVRAFGQPFTIVPVTALATATLARKDAGDGSAIFNMFRNLGGSVGIAILSTVVTRREQFHDTRIGERITALRSRVAGTHRLFVGAVHGARFRTERGDAAGVWRAQARRPAGGEHHGVQRCVFDRRESACFWGRC